MPLPSALAMAQPIACLRRDRLACQSGGLVVNAGHDLNLEKLPGLVASDAEPGGGLDRPRTDRRRARNRLRGAVRAYKAALAGG